MLKDASCGFYRTTIDEVELIIYQHKIYIPHVLCDCVLKWFYHYLNQHPGGDPLGNTVRADEERCQETCQRFQDLQHVKIKLEEIQSFAP